MKKWDIVILVAVAVVLFAVVSGYFEYNAKVKELNELNLEIQESSEKVLILQDTIISISNRSKEVITETVQEYIYLEKKRDEAFDIQMGSIQDFDPGLDTLIDLSVRKLTRKFEFD